MNIKTSSPNKVKIGQKVIDIKPLTDAEVDRYDVDSLEKVYRTKSMQFKTHDGTIFARLGIDINSPLALNYHYNKSGNFQQFRESIEKFLSNDDRELNSSDINRLEDDYRRYSMQLLKGSSVAQQVVDVLMED